MRRYFLPKGMQLLEQRLTAFLRANPDARIVSYMFSLPGATPTRKVVAKGTPVYLYTASSV